ncbi:trigger factor [Candidatus Saccharibacteria bacterium]|nr:trigger factor [Candidatus Saccharibacteria bacterium]
MHISRTNKSKTETKMLIRAEASELQKAKDLALKKLALQVNVPGFRSGKVPLAIIEKNVNPNLLQTEVIEETINTLYASAVRQEDLRPVANPEIAIKKFVPFTDLEFEVLVPTIGAIKLGDYTKINLARKTVQVSDIDIKNVIKSLQQRAAEKKDVQRAAKDGDQVWIDFKGTDDKGNPVQGADGKDYPLILGSNTFIPGFEANLIGANTGESRTFTLTFPKDYNVKALKSKKVTFRATVTKVQEVIEPTVDDVFASKIGPFKTVSELKSDIKKQLVFERSREAETAYENELLQKIADKTMIEIPEMLINEQIDRIEQEEKQNLTYRGQTWEEHLKEEGVTAEEHREQKHPVADQRVKIGVLLSEIAEKEQVVVTPEEVEIRLQLMKGQYRDAAAQSELEKPEALRDIATRIKTEKTLERIKSYQK